MQRDEYSPKCCFTVDVEDWYQSTIDFDAPISDRVVRNVERLSLILDEFKVKATFFVQGRVAETYPRLLQQLLAAGHEIQSHGYSHRPLFGMDRPALRNEFELARKSVEDACGAKVTAFRAGDFSILQQNLWALEEVAEAGFLVDSSVFPIRMTRYGIAGWELGPHLLKLPNGAELLEVPVAVWKWGGLKLPVSGGGYFRLLPRVLLECGLRSILRRQRPAIVYCHPYEFNSSELKEYRGRVSGRMLFLQGLGRESFVRRVRKLFARFPFGRFCDVVQEWRRVNLPPSRQVSFQ